MSETTTTIGKTYYTLVRIGYWCHLDAQCVTSADDDTGIVNHSVKFVLINSYGDTVPMGYAIISGGCDGEEVWDENGETFPTLTIAIRKHAAHLIAVAPMPEVPMDKPAPHPTWQGTMATAF